MAGQRVHPGNFNPGDFFRSYGYPPQQEVLSRQFGIGWAQQGALPVPHAFMHPGFSGRGLQAPTRQQWQQPRSTTKRKKDKKDKRGEHAALPNLHELTKLNRSKARRFFKGRGRAKSARAQLLRSANNPSLNRSVCAAGEGSFGGGQTPRTVPPAPEHNTSFHYSGERLPSLG